MPGPFKVTSELVEQVSLAQTIQSFGRRQAGSWGLWIGVCVVLVVGVRVKNKRKAMSG